MKAETESEGLSWGQISNLRIFSAELNLPFYLKIGGCEAKTDVVQSQQLNINYLIAPMIETVFAASKFYDSTSLKGLNENLQRLILIETKTAISNLTEILEYSQNWVSGINFGRTDLLRSLNLTDSSIKNFEDERFKEILEFAIYETKRRNLIVTVGGNMNKKNIRNFLSFKSLPDKIETRRFILSFDAVIEKPDILDLVLLVELELIESMIAKNHFSLGRLNEYKLALNSRFLG